VEAVAHPPELGGSVAGLALVRCDEEIETSSRRVGNLGGAPRAIVEFRSGGAAVDVGPDVLGRTRHRSCGPSAQFPSFGRTKFAANVCSPDTSKNASKADGRSEFLLVFSMRREKFPEKSGIEPMS
jgi:hypothetical protein